MQTKPARSMVLPRMVVTGPGVLEQIPAIIAELDIPERGLIVCDTNTLDIAGNQVVDYLEAGGHPMQKVKIKGANIEEVLIPINPFEFIRTFSPPLILKPNTPDAGRLIFVSAPMSIPALLK